MSKRDREKRRREWARRQGQGATATVTDPNRPKSIVLAGADGDGPTVTGAAPGPVLPVNVAEPIVAAEQSSVPTDTSAASLLLASGEVCRMLNLSRSTVDRLVKAGKLPGRIKIGGQVRFHRPTLEAWLCRLVDNSHADDAT